MPIKLPTINLQLAYISQADAHHQAITEQEHFGTYLKSTPQFVNNNTVQYHNTKGKFVNYYDITQKQFDKLFEWGITQELTVRNKSNSYDFTGNLREYSNPNTEIDAHKKTLVALYVDSNTTLDGVYINTRSQGFKLSGIDSQEVIIVPEQLYKWSISVVKQLRDFIGDTIEINGQAIGYRVFTANQYLEISGITSDMDQIEEEEYIEEHHEIVERLTQILALKQSCWLLRRTSHGCGRSAESLYYLQTRLIHELRNDYQFEFDDDLVEKYCGTQR